MIAKKILRWGSSTTQPPVCNLVCNPKLMWSYAEKVVGDPNRPAFGGAKEVPPDLSLSRCSTIILGWINDCQKHHRACVAKKVERPKLRDLPRRLVDAGKWEVASDPVALIDSKDFDVLQYATLSHCWGQHQLIKTTRETIAERKKCIQWNSLPKTFQDAISIVRSLDIRFIWIDSLCIIQDDGNDVRIGQMFACSIIQTLGCELESNTPPTPSLDNQILTSFSGIVSLFVWLLYTQMDISISLPRGLPTVEAVVFRREVSNTSREIWE